MKTDRPGLRVRPDLSPGPGPARNPDASGNRHEKESMADDDLQTRSLRAVWHPCTQMKQHEQLPLVALARGEGAWLVDTQGRRLLDGISSWWVNLFGHANPRINAALREQLDTLEHAMLAGFTHAPVVALSERLSARTGGALGHCFYASDGASAVEVALKMSHHAWRNAGRAEKREFVCVRGDYHGETLGALGVTDVPVFRDAYGSLLHAAHVVASPDARQAHPPLPPALRDAASPPLPSAGEGRGEGVETWGAAEAARSAIADAERLFADRADRIAAIVVEPLVQCATGMAMHDPSYLHALRALCDRYGVHFIADEIAVGFGRTGTFFACEQAGVWPDFLCLSKGISGGYLPLSVVMTREEIYREFYSDTASKAFLHSHSYTGNPLACRAALATLDIFEEDAVIERNRERGAALAARLQPLRDDPRVEHVRSRGMIHAFDVRPEALGADASSFARRFFIAALDRGVLLRPIGRTVYWMPPYILTDAECAHLAEATAGALDAALHAGLDGAA
ncbi:adenosylmethionine--8-amino-7-oxononanoate transaminase [Burkholderiales bacterium GJ-E10]|nr:adenosylmethionine--8-amino-7-oxononanoate transaminase [Burkholderiales bacterium GJ-E10]